MGMTVADLLELDGLLRSARAVVSLREVHAGEHGGDAIALRHDVDANHGSLDTAGRLARWERERGYRSTYFLLHTADYWHAVDFERKVERIAACGHEIGLHVNAIPEAARTGRAPDDLVAEAAGRLRAAGFDVVGEAAHGDALCYGPGRTLRFVNDEIFLECERPLLGALDRELQVGRETLRLEPRPLASYGLEYDALRIPRGAMLSDSGGKWTPTIGKTRDLFEAGLSAPLQILMHPDWWARAV